MTMSDFIGLVRHSINLILVIGGRDGVDETE